MFGKNKSHMPGPDEALPGRATEMAVPAKHFVNGHPLKAPFPEGLEMAMFGMGCFWGAERKFWQAERRLLDGSRLRRGSDAQPVVSRGLFRAHRTQRGGARGVRPQADHVRPDPQDLLGEPRPHAGHAPGQRLRHAVPIGPLLLR